MLLDHMDSEFTLDDTSLDVGCLLDADMSNEDSDVYSYEGKWIFFPKAQDKAHWDKIIANSKTVFNEFLPRLGLQSPKFTQGNFTINLNGELLTVPVMVTDNLQQFAKDTRSVLYGIQLKRGNNAKDILEYEVKAHDLVEKLTNIDYAKSLLKNILIQWVTCTAFRLPVEINQPGSAVLRFKFPQDETSAPSVGFLFTGFTRIRTDIPNIPTLDSLKNQVNNFIKPFATAIANIGAAPEDRFAANKSAIIADTLAKLTKAYDDEDQSLLTEAYNLVKITVAKYLEYYITTQEFSDSISGRSKSLRIYDLIISAIPTGDKELVEKLIALHGNFQSVSTDHLCSCARIAGNHSEPGVASIFKELVVKKTMDEFTSKYKSKLAEDKKAWFGLYAFFATSHVNLEKMSFDELLQHAQGLSKKGTGARTFSVLKDMGVLTPNKELHPKYRGILDSTNTNVPTNIMK